MSASTDQRVQANNPRFSNLTRFADMLKDSMSTKRAPTPTQPQPSLTNLEAENNNHLVHRRRSSTRYTEKMLQMLTPSNRPSSTTLMINDLPVEILQTIFLNLELFTLLRIRRVCKLWKNLIPGDSPLLAEVLFLKPSHNLHAYSFTPATFDFDFEIDSRATPRKTPYLRLQPTVLDGLSMSRRCIGLIRTSSEIIFHPIIANFNQYAEGSETGKPDIIVSKATPVDPVNWRSMLVAMPPLTTLRISRTVGRKVKTVRVLQAKDGIKLGDVFDTLDKLGEKEMSSSGQATGSG